MDCGLTFSHSSSFFSFLFFPIDELNENEKNGPDECIFRSFFLLLKQFVTMIHRRREWEMVGGGVKSECIHSGTFM
jgi:hypothetical protein